MARRGALLGLFVLVVCAGCVSPRTRTSTETPGPATPATPTTTATPTADDPTTVAATERTSGPASRTVTTGDTTDCPYSLHADVATEAQHSRTDFTNHVLAYADLPPARQREFRAAVANGSTELGGTLPETWAGPRIVDYRGEGYYVVASVC